MRAFSDFRRALFLTALRESGRISSAAAAAAVSRATIYRARKSDPAFKSQIDLAIKHAEAAAYVRQVKAREAAAALRASIRRDAKNRA